MIITNLTKLLCPFYIYSYIIQNTTLLYIITRSISINSLPLHFWIDPKAEVRPTVQQTFSCLLWAACLFIHETCRAVWDMRRIHAQFCEKVVDAC